MKKKGKTALSARLTALCMAALMALSLVPVQTAEAAGETFTKVTSADELTDGRYIMVTDTGYAPGVLDGTWISAEQVIADEGNGIQLGNTIQENADTVWEVSVTSADGAEDLTVTLKDKNGTFIAPKGGNNNGVSEGEYNWKVVFDQENQKFTFSGQGDDTVVLASNKGSQNKFRAYKTTTVSGNPNAYPSEFTLYKADDGGSSSVTVAAPQATPQAGEVESGTVVALTTSTAGAQIYFTLDGSDPADANNETRQLYSEDDQPVITEDCTLRAAAVLEGVYSAVQELKYTVAESGQDEPVLKDGDQVVIYAPAYNKALSAEYTGYYNKGTDVTVSEDGTLSGYTDMDVWTVTDNGDGTYSFSHDGQNIGMGDSYSSMPLGEKNDKWVLEDAGNGLYYVKNTVRNAYMEWYDSNGNWSAYYNIAEGSEGMFALAFYKVTDVPGGSDEPDAPSAVEGLEVEASPKSGASVVEGQKITLEAADGAEIYYTMNTDGTEPADPEAGNAEQLYTEPLEIAATPEKDKPIIVKALAYIPQNGDAEAQTGEVYTFTYKAPMMIEDYGLYFGQLHAHTNLSDGTGTVEQAFEHAANVENLDFLALTDHSNSFEGQSGLPGAGTTHLGDENAEEVNASWREGREGARAITAQEGDFVGIYGFEMTWSGGAPGHINTFNSEGFENRNAEPYRKGDNYEVLEAYYNTLNENPETISQFNHPGDTFGDFMDFALYDPVIDNQMTLIEVGNGEGAIGSSGYFPSYSYYTRALDKGWHVAPTNNQDNHKGNWGDSNTARSVVLSDGLSEDAIYDAMKNYRVYATEDNDLSILYSLNGNAMGSILDEQDEINIKAEISDPTDTSGETKVEVIVNGGQTLAEKTFTGGSATVEFNNLSTGYGYYYLRITQADKQIAVTAPVWTGESVNAGISNTSSDVAMPIRGDEINISSQIFNNLSDDMTVTSLTYTMEGQTEPFHTADVSQIGDNGVISARGSFTYSFPYTADQAGGFNINAELKALIGGEEYTFTDVLKLSVSDPSIATKVLIDGTHYNDYVNGYYSGNMTNFINMGTSDNIQVKIVQPGEEVTPEMLQDVSLFVISAPLKYTSDYTGEAQPSVFEDEFVDAVSDYVNGGGTVVVCGLADYQDANSGLPYTSYEQANKLLEGMGSTMRINDDELIDQDENGGQPYRLYFDDFNYDSTDPAVQSILEGVAESGLTYSSYSGCSVSVGEGEAIVYGHDTTYSINSKAPAQGHDKPVLSYSAPYDASTAVVPKGEVVSMATEAVGSGRVYACGTVFCSNFEVSAEDQVSYANGIMAQNLLSDVKVEPEISTIQEARAGEDGEVFTVIGTVANGTAESGNAFFNTIYIQDDEGNGINVFPIDDSNIRRGDQVQVTGSVSEYIGDKQLSAISVTVLEGSKDVVITDVTTKEANDYDTNFGRLVRVKGKVVDFTLAGGIVESITVQDDSGESCRVFIDGYIGYSDETSQALEEFVQDGAYISAVGFVSHDAEGNRLRVRDRSEILPAEEGEQPVPENYEVTVSIQNGSFEGPESATAGQDYTGKIVAADGYQLPEQITVKAAGKELSAGGIFRAADYTYDPETGVVTIAGKAVTGNIEISAVCEAAPGQGGNPGEGGQNPTPGSGGQQNGSQTDGNAQLTGNGQQNTGSSGNSAADSKTVQTGDDTSAVLWITVLAAAVLIGGTTTVIIIRKRRG
ncbi:CehA/McbA family metallohydrolase [Mediterraneibacter glycyrrhizinilyticus]|uniref:CehA/McbA family metallohydrolase n=1 Tax=Mediterraneibacter glycyrrhizinilyticus TaxID=342942 RepID=UPI0025A336B3|nr:CehA/McbA family metallohydrolase [Mediterraneibacter glycyrrhizinilyticus]MDM8124119.1 CehA/McbA family metallohydrolase [Mediterraneibacter glycyrrhizinilyticus]